jgi:DNA-binding response OmpR family regulator
MNKVKERRNVSGDRAPRILLVDDEPHVLQTLGIVLEDAGYDAVRAANAAHALRLSAETGPHVAVVDYGLSGSARDSLELIGRLNERDPLMVCLLMTVYDKGAIGFRANQEGAFTCLVKPFSNTVLLDAVRAALDERRRRKGTRGCLHIGDMVIDLVNHRVTVIGQPISLSGHEIDLLACMARHPGRMASYDQLWKEVWGYTSPPNMTVIRKAISRLREKIGKDRIVARWGKGYRLVGDPPGRPHELSSGLASSRSCYYDFS